MQLKWLANADAAKRLSTKLLGLFHMPPHIWETFAAYVLLLLINDF